MRNQRMRHGAFGTGRVQRGFVKAALLIELLDGPGHGYELGKRIEHKTGGRWSPGPGSIYPTLDLLTDGGLVTATEADGKRIYELTDHGTSAAREAKERFADRFDPDGPAASMRTEVTSLIDTIRSVGRTATDEQAALIAELLETTRKQVLRILAE